MKTRTISKSRYIDGLRCDRLLWCYFHRRELFEAPRDAATTATLESGNRVGDLAKRLFPSGVEVEWGDDWNAGFVRTKELLAALVPIFEAGFRAPGVYARPDIIVPAPGGKFDLVEVKRSANVKEYQVDDVAFQRYVCEAVGLPIRRCFVMHVDSTYERVGDLDPAHLLVREDVTEATAEILPEIPARLKRMQEIVAMVEIPECGDADCDNPWRCPLADVDDCPCASESEPEQGHVNELYWDTAGRKAALLAAGITRLADIPDGWGLTERQEIQVAVARSGAVHVDRDGIRGFLARLEYPLHFLDFETIYQEPVPPYDRTRPYEQIPFQFSVHVVKAPGEVPVHHEFLPQGDTTDPRPVLLGKLRDAIGPKGSVLAWNASFETRALERMAEVFPAHAGWIRSAVSRIVDLIDPFRAFHWHHPAQRGSNSLKRVLPAMTGKGYDGMEIGDGATAAAEFTAIAFGDPTEDERARVREALLRYCELDTMGMVEILCELEKSVGTS